MRYDNIRAAIRHEIATLQGVLATLDQLGAADQHIGPRRGRKSMGAAERLVVSARMKRYWAGRRKARGAA